MNGLSITIGKQKKKKVMVTNRLKFDITARDRSKQALRSVQNNLRVTQSAVARLTRVLAPLATIFSVAVLGRRLIETNKTFQQLQASLTTFTGSVENGQRAFTILQNFASDTPFALREVVEGFNVLISRGIQPTMENLKAFGDIASGSGRDFASLANAIANASVGEFETLKQFGIKANKEQEKIRISFGNTTQVIENKKDVIVSALTELAQVNFAGATERQAQTLTGAFSNFGDAVDKVMFQIGSAGLNKEINKLTRDLTKFISKNDQVAKKISGALVRSLRALVGAFKLVGRNLEEIGFGLGIVFGAVIVRKIASVVRAVITFTKAIITAKIVTATLGALLKRPQFLIGFGVAVGGVTVAVSKYKEELLDLIGDLKVFELISSAQAQVTEKFTTALGINTSGLEAQAKALENTGEHFVFASSSATKASSEMQKFNLNFSEGAKTGVDEYFKSIQDGAKNSAEFTKNAFQSLEQALSEFFQTGKFNFNSFRDAIMKGLADLTAKSVIGAGQSALGGLAKGFGGAIGSAIGKIGGGFLRKILPFNQGGSVPGSGNRDSVLAGLTPGEFVVNAQASKKFRPLLERVNSYRSGGEIQDAISLGIGLGSPQASQMANAFTSAGNQGIDSAKAEGLILNAFGIQSAITKQVEQVKGFAELLGMMGFPIGSFIKTSINLINAGIRRGIFPQKSSLADLQLPFQTGLNTESSTVGLKSGNSRFVSNIDEAFKKLVATASPFLLEQRAKGGNVNSGQPYLVGESGAEIMTPGSSGNISPVMKEGGIIDAVLEVKNEVAMMRKSFQKVLAGQDLAGSRV